MGYYWNPNKVYSSFELSNNNRDAECISDEQYQTCIGEESLSGKIYFEIEQLEYVQFGAIGICTDSHNEDDRNGFTDYSWSWMENGRLYHDSSYTGTSEWETDSLLQVAVDIPNHKMWFGKDGSWIDSGDPENGNSPAFEDSDITGTLFISMSMRYTNDKVRLNILNEEFSYTPPSGFSAIATAIDYIYLSDYITSYGTDLSGHSVTELDDVSASGSGQIISSTERTNIGNNTTHSTGDGSDHDDVASNTTHRGSTDNPHSTDLGNIGSGTLAELNASVSDATVKDKSYIDSLSVTNIIKNGIFEYNSWIDTYPDETNADEEFLQGWNVYATGTAPDGTISRDNGPDGGSQIIIDENTAHNGKFGVYQIIKNLGNKHYDGYLKFVVNIGMASSIGDSTHYLEIEDNSGATRQAVTSTGLQSIEKQISLGSEDVTIRAYIEGDGSTENDRFKLYGCMALISSEDFDFDASAFGGISMDGFSSLINDVPDPIQDGDPVSKSYSDKNFTPVQNIAINGLFAYDSWIDTSPTQGDKSEFIQGWEQYPQSGYHNGNISRFSDEDGAGSIVSIDLDPAYSTNKYGISQTIKNLNSRTNHAYVKFIVNVYAVQAPGLVTCKIEINDGDNTTYTESITSTGMKKVECQIPSNTSSEDVDFRIYLEGDGSNDGSVGIAGCMILVSEKDFNYDETSFASLAMSPHDALINNIPNPVQDGDPVAKKYLEDNYPYQRYSKKTASSHSEISFKDLAEGTYKVILKNVIPATDNVYLKMLVSDDGGSTWKTSGYQCACTVRHPSGQLNTGSSSEILLTSNTYRIGSDTGEHGYSGEITMYNVNDSSYDFHSYNFGLWFTAADDICTMLGCGGGYEGTDIDAVKFLFSSGDIESGEFILEKID